MRKNIEDYLRDNKGESGEFRLKVMECSDSHLIIYINPVDRDGESFDGYVVLEMVQEKSKIENMFEEVRKNVIKSLSNNTQDGEVF